MTYSTDRATDRPALFALVGLSLIFAAIVGYGWSRNFWSWNLPVVPYLAGLVLALVAMALAYATAAERLQCGRTNSVAAAYFFVLFLISALGTINTLFINFSGVTIMKEGIASAQEATLNLRNKAPQLLPTSDWDAFEKNVNVKLLQLNQEIKNPRLCGQGPEAAKIMRELVVLLPNFRPLAGGGCDNSSQIVSAYERQVSGLLKSSAEYQAVSKRISIRDEVVAKSSKTLESLDSSSKSLTGVSDIGAAKKVLEEAAGQYAAAKQTLDSGLTQPSSLPSKIDTSSAAALGNIGYVVSIVFTRWLDLTTYFYVFVALMLDVILVIAFQKVLRSGIDPMDRQKGAKAVYL